MKKTDREYAEKLGKLHAESIFGDYKEIMDLEEGVRYENRESNFIEGYMTAIKENNVTELIEALEKAKKELMYHMMNLTNESIFMEINNALKKSKEI